MSEPKSMPVVIITPAFLLFSVKSSPGRISGWVWDISCRCFSKRREYVTESSGGQNCCSKIVFGGADGATVGGTSLVMPGRSGGSLPGNRSKRITPVMAKVGVCRGGK